MTKHPSVPSIRITYVNDVGEPQMIGVREIFCRMDVIALVLIPFENAEGEKVKELPLAVTLLEERDTDVDDAGRLYELALTELGHVPIAERDRLQQGDSGRSSTIRQWLRPCIKGARGAMPPRLQATEATQSTRVKHTNRSGSFVHDRFGTAYATGFGGLTVLDSGRFVGSLPG